MPPRASKVTVTRADGVVVQQARGGRRSVSNALQRDVFARDGKCCRYCAFRHSDIRKFDVEHVIPVSRGGCDEMSNLVVACKRCNRLKSDTVWVPLSLAKARRLGRPLTIFDVLRSQGVESAVAHQIAAAESPRVRRWRESRSP